MSKKNQKNDQGTGTTDQGTAGTTPKRGGRKPMTEAQKATNRVTRELKDMAELEQFSDPAIWAKLDPVVLAKVEAAIVHVRTVIHAAEREALRARLAALDTPVQG